MTKMDEIKFYELGKEVAKSIADKLAKERNAAMLYELYERIGWHEVKLHTWHDRDEASEIWCWCRDHLTGQHYYHLGNGWLFELESDAILFMLRWS